MTYAKLDSGLIHSTVWREPAPTRLVWITMLAMKDRHGEVMASVPGLADAARVSIEETEAALRCFLSPDPYSRTKAHDGRRIEEIPGGWLVLNHDVYRALENDDDRRAKDAARAKRYRERKRDGRDASRDARDGRDESRESRHTDADTDTEAIRATTLSAKEPRKRKEASASRTSWLTPYIDTWEARHGAGSAGTLAGRMGKALRSLDAAHGSDIVARRLAWYLRETEPRFQSVEKFAQTFAQWDPDAPGFTAEEIGG